MPTFISLWNDALSRSGKIMNEAYNNLTLVLSMFCTQSEFHTNIENVFAISFNMYMITNINVSVVYCK